MLISGGLEVVGAFAWAEGVEKAADVSAEGVDIACRVLAQQGLEFGDGHFDGVHVR